MSTLPPPTPTPTPSPIFHINDGEIRAHLTELVRGSVEETLNPLLDTEADALCGAKRYERHSERTDYRAGHYERGLETKAGRERNGGDRKCRRKFNDI